MKFLDLDGLKTLIEDFKTRLNKKADKDKTQKELDKKEDKLGYTPESVDNKGQSGGYAPLGANKKVPLQNLPDIAQQQTYVVQTRDDMLSLDNLIIGEKCFIVEDSDTYIWDGVEWLVLSKAEWGELNVKWSDIQNRPSSSTQQIDSAVRSSHTHKNKEELDRVDERMFDDIQQARWHILSGTIHTTPEEKSEIEKIKSKADKDSVYTKRETDTKLKEKANVANVENLEREFLTLEADIDERLGSQIERQVGVDYNDFKSTGFYFLAPSQDNAPEALQNSAIYLTVLATDSNVYQRAVSYRAGKIAKRQYRNGSWDKWSYDLSLTKENIEQELGYVPANKEELPKTWGDFMKEE